MRFYSSDTEALTARDIAKRYEAWGHARQRIVDLFMELYMEGWESESLEIMVPSWVRYAHSPQAPKPPPR